MLVCGVFKSYMVSVKPRHYSIQWPHPPPFPPVLILSPHPLPLFFSIVKYISREISLKLTTKNFLLWKTQVLLVLSTHKLIGFIDGTLSKSVVPLADVA